MSRRTPQEITPEALRDSLSSAMQRRDYVEFAWICSAHTDEIRAAFSSWLRVSESMLSAPEQIQAYCNTLFAIARCMEAAGHPELMEQLTGGNNHPVLHSKRIVQSTDALDQAGDPRAAFDRLLGVAKALDDYRGPAVDEVRGLIYGRLALYRNSMGDIAGATFWVRRALAECKRTGDTEGVRIYARDLEVYENLSQQEREDAVAAHVRRRVVRAQQLSDDAEFAASNTLLDELLDEQTESEAVQRLLGKIYGLRGLNFYQLNQVPEARDSTQSALAACESAGDSEGMWVYEQNLRVLGRIRP